MIKEHRDAPKSTTIHEEYHRAVRTKSYADFCNKAQLLANHPSKIKRFSEFLLEPDQETIPSILDSATFSNTPELKNIMLTYFDISAEASHICSNLLKGINQVHSDYQFFQRALDIDDGDSLESFELIIIELSSFIISSDPFSNLENHDFKLIHDKHSSVLHHLKSMRKRVGRQIKHLKRKIGGFKFSGSGSSLSKVYDQLDIAAKGTYIMNRDFDTMSRLVARLQDEIEHSRAMVQFCLDRKEDRVSLQIVKELKKSDFGFRKHVEELEEHVYLCLVTINRARALVIKEMKNSRA